MRLSKLAPAALFALVALAAPAAHSQVTINIFQSGADVDALATGTLNLTGLTLQGSSNAPSAIQGTIAAVLVGNSSTGYDIYSGFTGPVLFGSGGLFAASSGSGDRFAIVGGQNNLAVTTGYVSGSSINGSAVFSGQTLSSLGLTTGTYTYTLPQSTITVQIGPAAVPEPGSVALLIGLTTTGAGFLSRRRRRHATV